MGDRFDRKTENLPPDERRSPEIQELRSDSADVALELAIALRNVELGSPHGATFTTT